MCIRDREIEKVSESPSADAEQSETKEPEEDEANSEKTTEVRTETPDVYKRQVCGKRTGSVYNQSGCCRSGTIGIHHLPCHHAGYEKTGDP